MDKIGSVRGLGEPFVFVAWPKMGGWLRFSPDGHLLVVTGFAGIKLYSTESWAQLAELQGHTQAIAAGDISRDGRLLATASTDSSVRLWSLPAPGDAHSAWTAQSAPLATLPLHKKTAAAVAIAPNGALLASGGYDARVVLFDLQRGGERAILKGHAGNVVSLAFAPDSTLLASGGLGSEALLWATATDASAADAPAAGAPARPLLHLGGHNAVSAVLGWRDGALLTTDYGATLRAWNPADGALLATAQLDVPTVTAAAFSPDGATLAVTAPHTIALFNTSAANIARWELIDTISLPIKGVYAASWSPDGTQLAVSGADGKVRIYPVLRG